MDATWELHRATMEVHRASITGHHGSPRSLDSQQPRPWQQWRCLLCIEGVRGIASMRVNLPKFRCGDSISETQPTKQKLPKACLMFAHNQTHIGWLVRIRPKLPRLSFVARLQETNEPNRPMSHGGHWPLHESQRSESASARGTRSSS